MLEAPRRAPCFNLYRLSGLLNPDRAPVFLFVFLHLCIPTGGRFGAGFGSSFLFIFLRLTLAWRPSNLEPVGFVQTGARFRFGVWLEASSFLQMEPWPASILNQ